MSICFILITKQLQYFSNYIFLFCMHKSFPDAPKTKKIDFISKFTTNGQVC